MFRSLSLLARFKQAIIVLFETLEDRIEGKRREEKRNNDSNSSNNSRCETKTTTATTRKKPQTNEWQKLKNDHLFAVKSEH